MDESLISVGLDVGTSTTQLVVSRLHIQNQASSFAVPELKISEKQVIYESPVYLTPLLDDSHIDGEGVRRIVAKEYEAAKISRESVDTGAVIITGETSRKENAEAVLSALSQYAGDFVVATAGPDLESRLAAKGSGAAAYSGQTGKTLLHMDIGGGTSNFALIKAGEILDTGCLNVGGRLLTYDDKGKILWISRALEGMTQLKPGDTFDECQGKDLAETLAQVLEMAAGLRKTEDSLQKLVTLEGKLPDLRDVPEDVEFSFSGGVADCMKKKLPWKAFGDLGPLLGRAILDSRLCQRAFHLGENAIRATVIGAGCHAAQLSGSTVFYQNMEFPLKNIPAVILRPREDPKKILASRNEMVVLALEGIISPSYEEILSLADRFAGVSPDKPLILSLRQDMAKALGQALALRLGREAKILCMDQIVLGEESYLDVGKPLGPAIPVVVKTLILSKGGKP